MTRITAHIVLDGIKESEIATLNAVCFNGSLGIVEGNPTYTFTWDTTYINEAPARRQIRNIRRMLILCWENFGHGFNIVSTDAPDSDSILTEMSRDAFFEQLLDSESYRTKEARTAALKGCPHCHSPEATNIYYAFRPVNLNEDEHADGKAHCFNCGIHFDATGTKHD